MKTKFNKIFISVIWVSLLFVIASTVSAGAETDSIKFIGLYNGTGLIRDCPSFDCKIIKYGGTCPLTEVLYRSNNWYKVIFTVRGVYEEGIRQINVCGDKDEKILPKSVWVAYEGWMPDIVIPPEVRSAVIEREFNDKKEIPLSNNANNKETIPVKNSVPFGNSIKLQVFITVLLGMIFVFLVSRRKKIRFLPYKKILIISIVAILFIIIGGAGFFTYKSYKQQQELYRQEIEKLKLDTQEAIKKAGLKAELKAETAQETAEETKRRIEIVERKEKEQLLNQSTALIKKWASSIVKLTCSAGQDAYSQGSGTLFYNAEDGTYTVFTNYHVVAPDDKSMPFCVVTIYPNSPLLTGALAYMSDTGSFKYFGSLDMIAFNIIPIGKLMGLEMSDQSFPDSLSYLYSFAIDGKSMKLCGVPRIGEKVFILGYPAIGGDSLTVTDGIIAGIENTDVKYYKTSAKIEHGNSGGAAILERGCLLGIPTLSILGEIESLAYILPFE